MDYRKARRYYRMITVIEAQKTLLDMQLRDYPRMKDHDRKNFHSKMRAEAFPPGLQKEMTFDEFFEVMGHGGPDSN